MSNQFYEPATDDLVACDDGLHFILLDEANAHCNWVMRRHPGGGLVSVRKATEHELVHAKARQHLRAGAAQIKVGRMEIGDLNNFTVFAQRLREYNHNPHHINPMSEAFHKLIGDAADALAAQRDEGLAREAVMQKQLGELWQEISTLNQTIESVWTEHDALQQRLAEAVALVDRALLLVGEPSYSWMADAGVFMATHSPGCADGDKP